VGGENMSIYLKKFNLEDLDKECEFFTTHEGEHGYTNPYYCGSKEEFMNNSVKQILDSEKGINLKPGYVPGTYFLLWEDDHIVGCFNVRHYLNSFLEQGAGHIGYYILPQYRRRGFAKLGLSLALKEIVKLDDFDKERGEVYLSCAKDNIGSLKTMLANNGYIHHEDDTEYYLRIKIK
jgi:predicted acetyltransferase